MLRDLKRSRTTRKPGRLAPAREQSRGILRRGGALGLLGDITQAIVESPDLPAALQVALQKVCEATGWSYGEVWMPHPDEGVLKCRVTWHRKTASLGAFVKATRRLVFPPGLGLPGRVWATKQPEWIEDISVETRQRFPRARLARKFGLKAGFAFPLVADGGVLAVFVFFLSTAQKENKQAAALVSAVARQMGSLIQRQRAEEALRRAKDELEGEVQKRTETLAETNRALQAEICERHRAEESLRREHNFISTILGTVDALVVVLDPKGRIVYFNRACEQTTGYKSKEVVGHPFWDILLTPEEAGAVKEVFEELRLGGLPSQYENYWVAKDGKRRRIAWSNNVLSDEAGAVAHVIGAGIDITERQQALETVLESEATIRALLESASQSILAINEEGRIMLANSVTKKIFGYRSEEIIGRPLEVLFPQADAENLARRRAEYFSRLRTGPLVPALELAGLRKDGEAFPAEVRLSYIQTKRGILAVSFISDITERKRADAALRESEEKFRVLTEAIAAAVFIYQDEGFRYVNPAVEKLTGYSRAELMKMRFWEVVHPDVRELIRERGMARQRGDRVPSRYELPIVTKQGEELWTDFAAGSITFEGRPAGLGTAFDITARKRIEEELRHSEFRTRALLNAMPDLMFRYRLDGTYLDFHAHRGAELAIPPEAIVGANVSQLPLAREVIDQILAASRRAIETAEVQTVEYTLDLPSGRQSFEARIVGSGPDELVAVVRNITERKRAEEALRESEERFRRLAETARVIAWEADLATWQFTYVSPQAVEILGYPIEDWYRKDFWVDHIHPEDRQWTVQYCLEHSAQFRNYEFEYRMMASDGRTVWLRDLVTVTPGEGGAGRLGGLMVDITERKQAEKELRASAEALGESQRQLRGLTARLISAREEESKRLARELHDAFSQRLAVLGMEAATLEQRLPPADAVRQGVRAMGEEIGRLSREVHQISRQIHPSILDDLGLTAALRSECAAFSKQLRIPIRFEPSEVPEPLPGNVSLGLYRIVQESLRNVGKHSGAAAARVVLAGSADRIRLVVEDNGKGFDLGRMEGRRGLGLVSMEERVRLVNGSFQIRSEPGAGTTIEVQIPLRRSSP